MIGFGDRKKPPIERDNIEWLLIPEPQHEAGSQSTRPMSLRTRLACCVHSLPWPLRRLAYLRWYWSRPHYRAASLLATTMKQDLYISNDWNALPIAALGKPKFGSRIVFDAHEYGPPNSNTIQRGWL